MILIYVLFFIIWYKKYTIERNANFYNDDYLYRLNKHHKGVFTQADVNNAFNSIGLAGRSTYFR